MRARERRAAVRCKQPEPTGGERKDREQASCSRQTGHMQGFWDNDEPEGDRDVTNRGFPHKRYKPRKPRPTLRESPNAITLTVNKARSFLRARNAK